MHAAHQQCNTTDRCPVDKGHHRIVIPQTTPSVVMSNMASNSNNISSGIVLAPALLQEYTTRKHATAIFNSYARYLFTLPADRHCSVTNNDIGKNQCRTALSWCNSVVSPPRYTTPSEPYLGNETTTYSSQSHARPIQFINGSRVYAPRECCASYASPNTAQNKYNSLKILHPHNKPQGDSNSLNDSLLQRANLCYSDQVMYCSSRCWDCRRCMRHVLAPTALGVSVSQPDLCCHDIENCSHGLYCTSPSYPKFLTMMHLRRHSSIL